jgi:hypothetical protein
MICHQCLKLRISQECLDHLNVLDQKPYLDLRNHRNRLHPINLVQMHRQQMFHYLVRMEPANLIILLLVSAESNIAMLSV